MLPYLGEKKKLFADIVRLETLRYRDHSGLSRWALNPMTSVRMRDTHEVFDIQKRRRQDDSGGRD